MIYFTYVGKVKGQARPRFKRNGAAYKTKAAREYEEAIRESWENCTGGESYGSAPVVVVINVYRALPKSRPKRVTTEPDIYKPDADNIAKAVLDALQDQRDAAGRVRMGAFFDDAQVVGLHVTKHPRERVSDNKDRMIIAIYTLGEWEKWQLKRKW